ncbi:hypothetical protein [Actinobaculum sp. 313]|uniref:hypothetical protein n=1 Tax=Actinobaculum sp. 313 TaxID=2495645 RepID=UPI001F0BC3DF|nr:hypothetical protein [Actinobaculum sp. 313]
MTRISDRKSTAGHLGTLSDVEPARRVDAVSAAGIRYREHDRCRRTAFVAFLHLTRGACGLIGLLLNTVSSSEFLQRPLVLVPVQMVQIHPPATSRMILLLPVCGV